MMVYDALVNHVATDKVPRLLQSICSRTVLQLAEKPSRNSVEQMSRELGSIGTLSSLQCAEFAMNTANNRLGSDATTQEGMHVNCIRLISATDTAMMAIDQLPGGLQMITNKSHIVNSINDLSKLYSSFHNINYIDCRELIINNIANTMSDRAVVNHTTISKLEEE
jgi:hypothetical protein